ncbi:MAG: GNAT family N-acetyltransferase [Anaerolineae bacterium]|nr:GNAT family N-acetyltransferase [Anaerolineae bacterium]
MSSSIIPGGNHSIQIRAAAKDDLPGMAAIWHEKTLLQQQFAPNLRLLPDARDRWSQAVGNWLEMPDHRVWVGEDQGVLTGYLIAQIQDSPPGWDPPRHGAIVDLGVDMHITRGGTGKLLLTTALDWFWEQQLRYSLSAVLCTQPVEQAFWRSQGTIEWQNVLWLTL